MATNADSAKSRSTLLRKIHSLTGVLPLGVFLVVHTWTNLAIRGGQEGYTRAVTRMDRLPLAAVVEVLFVLAPLAFHAAYGVVLALRSDPDPAARGYARRGLHTLERVSGLLVLVFVIAHVWEFRAARWFFGLGAESLYTTLEKDLSWTWSGVPLVALGYLVGIAATTFHLANGLVAFCASWGITTSNIGKKRATLAFTALGSVLFLVSMAQVVELATGSPLLPRKGESKTPGCEAVGSVEP